MIQIELDPDQCIRDSALTCTTQATDEEPHSGIQSVDTSFLLAALITGGGFIAACASAVNLARSIRAEHRFVEVYRRNIPRSERLATTVLAEFLTQDRIDLRNLVLAHELFDPLLSKLSRRDQNFIRQGLDQPSLRGQANYMAKLIWEGARSPRLFLLRGNRSDGQI